MSNFQKELTQLLNRHSIENYSDTPDFILSAYLNGCLEAFNKATVDKDLWQSPADKHKPLTERE
jgi:hypothetical protein